MYSSGKFLSPSTNVGLPVPGLAAACATRLSALDAAEA